MERIKSNADGTERKQGKRFRVLVVISWSKRTMLPLHNEQYGENWAEEFLSSLIGTWEFLEAVLCVWTTTLPRWTQGWVSWRAWVLQDQPFHRSAPPGGLGNGSQCHPGRSKGAWQLSCSPSSPTVNGSSCWDTITWDQGAGLLCICWLLCCLCEHMLAHGTVWLMPRVCAAHNRVFAQGYCPWSGSCQLCCLADYTERSPLFGDCSQCSHRSLPTARWAGLCW